MLCESFSLFHQMLPLLFIVAILFNLTASFVKGQTIFTEEPPRTLYVPSGGNATFNWKYFVHDRESTFDIWSPKWSFYDEHGTEHVIGSDFKFDSWNWRNLTSCPQRLLKPTIRVSRKENATLVITNVTTADSGIYGCTLVLKSPPPVKSDKVHLVVTVKPQIHITGESSVLENTDVTLNCSAIGPPTPNVTWINNNAGVILENGIQSATLFIRNITREQNGKSYNCNATNNPTEDPVQKKIIVTVKFPPEQNKALSSGPIEACPGDAKELVCAGNGYPPPTYYWYNPQNVSMGPGKKTGKITVNPVPGNWTCYITNGVGNDSCCKVKITVLPSDHRYCKLN